ncbi:hypothetical protein B0H17DRAFT_1145897 [Mycena rosella]|uniref:Uncharacterized protein n=1 Tax=Mycena rosella TaxID=1033263 RepID=A0AAD7CQ07_MYCRO|nr:hypothetical protein B0H17DRAFT_1145897 [Mycena rosella]
MSGSDIYCLIEGFAMHICEFAVNCRQVDEWSVSDQKLRAVINPVRPVAALRSFSLRDLMRSEQVHTSAPARRRNHVGKHCGGGKTGVWLNAWVCCVEGAGNGDGAVPWGAEVTAEAGEGIGGVCVAKAVMCGLSAGALPLEGHVRDESREQGQGEVGEK